MKTRFLFPHKWRPAGLVLLALGLISYFINSHYSNDLIAWQDTHPLWYGWNVVVLVNDLANAFSIIFLIAGLVVSAFSKEKIEDEQIMQLRLDSLQWALYLNYFILIICVLIFKGWGLLSVVSYNLFTPLLILIIRFRWKIYQLNQLFKKEIAS
jgi:hypothetical protein